MLNKKILKSFSFSLLFAFTISACSNTNNLNSIPQFDTNNLNTVSSLSVRESSVDSLIEKFSQNKTEWGFEVDSLPSVPAKKVTLLSYLAFDNDKGGWRDELRPMINHHELAGSSNNVNLVLQTDGEEKQDTKRYYVVNENTSTISSPYTKFKYEKNSGDYRTLRSFIRWGFSTYKSQLKILDVNNHGGAFYGIANDDTSGKMISLPNISKAISSSINKVDILTFDACLMAALEVGYELRNNANIMIGSEDSTINTGMLYVNNIHNIINKSRNAEEIAKNIVFASDRQGVKGIKDERKNRRGKIPNVFTISAFRGGKYMQNVGVEMNNLSKVLLSKMPQYKNAYKVALSGTHMFYVDEDMSQGQRDVYEVLSRLNTIVKDPQIQSAISQARKAINNAIIISRAHNLEKYAQGMAINISPDSVASIDYQNTSFAKNTLWDEFIIQTFK